MADFTGELEDEAKTLDDFNYANLILQQIDEQAFVGDAMMLELEGMEIPKTIAMLLGKAKQAYMSGSKALVDIDPFTGDEEKALFIRTQGEARRYRDMIHWIEAELAASRYKTWFNDDETARKIRRESELNERQGE